VRDLVLSFFFSSRRRHTRCLSDWSSDVCSSDLLLLPHLAAQLFQALGLLAALRLDLLAAAMPDDPVGFQLLDLFSQVLLALLDLPQVLRQPRRHLGPGALDGHDQLGGADADMVAVVEIGSGDGPAVDGDGLDGSELAEAG